VLDENVRIFNSVIKATQIKRDESDSQSFTKVLHHQKPLLFYWISR